MRCTPPCRSTAALTTQKQTKWEFTRSVQVLLFARQPSLPRSHCPHARPRPSPPTRPPQSKRYSHGVRLAKVHALDSDLMNLALKSTPTVMVDTADYLFEKVAACLPRARRACTTRRLAPPAVGAAAVQPGASGPCLGCASQRGGAPRFGVGGGGANTRAAG